MDTLKIIENTSTKKWDVFIAALFLTAKEWKVPHVHQWAKE